MAARLVASATPPWFVHTCRAIRWRPLVSVAIAEIAAMAALLALDDRVPASSLGTLAAALLVSCALVALDDTCAVYLRVVPISEMRRLARRLVLVAPATIAAIAAVYELLATHTAGAYLDLAPLVALALAALAVHVWSVQLGWERRLAAALVPPLWATAGIAIERGFLAPISQAWQRWPVSVSIASGGALIAGVIRGER